MPDMSEMPVLSYRTPQKSPEQSPLDPVWATVLSLPGVCGFSLLAGALVFWWRTAWDTGPRAGIFLWAVAFVCAIVSFFYFRGRPKSAWVKICLAMNWLGVAFTLTPPGWIVPALAITASR